MKSIEKNKKYSAKIDFIYRKMKTTLYSDGNHLFGKVMSLFELSTKDKRRREAFAAFLGNVIKRQTTSTVKWLTQIFESNVDDWECKESENYFPTRVDEELCKS